MHPVKRFFYSAQKAIKKSLKKILPGRLWIFLRKNVKVKAAFDREHRSNLMKEWIDARQSCQNDPNADFPEGVNVVGYFNAATGLGEAARSSVRALKAAGIPFSQINIDFDVPERQRIELFESDRENGFRYRINLLHVNPNHMPYLWEKFGKSALLGHRTIGVWYWELLSIPGEWETGLQVVDEVWVPTQFVFDAIKPVSPVPVYIVPPSVEVDFDASCSRADFGLPPDRYLFLCVYDALSGSGRKNPEGAIAAFREAFSPNDLSVGLVVKINNAEENPGDVKYLEHLLQGYDNVYFIKRVLPRTQINALINLVDCYVSLHRSEGFGLVAAEAMYLGKPVVMTKWSGNLDFLSEENACGVGFQLVPVGNLQRSYDPEEYWAEPRLDEAAAFMQRLAREKDFSIRIGQNAGKTIRQQYSTDKMARLIRGMLSPNECG